MAKAENIYKQMQQAMGQYEQMAPADAGSIESDLMSKVDFMRPQYEELAGVEQGAYSSTAPMMEQYRQKYGERGGPGAFNRLSSVMSNVGSQYGTADALANAIETQRGRIGQMAGDLSSQYQQARQAQMDKYNMLQPLYQSAVQQRESQKEREMRERLSRASRGGGGSATLPINIQAALSKYMETLGGGQPSGPEEGATRTIIGNDNRPRKEYYWDGKWHQNSKQNTQRFKDFTNRMGDKVGGLLGRIF